VVLVYADIAADFGTSKEKVAFLTTATLLMRPVAFLVLIGKEAKRVEFGRSDTISEPVAAR
jgi:SHS family lactate transporter-like MFS transporter